MKHVSWGNIGLTIILCALALFCLRLSTWQHSRWLEKKEITVAIHAEKHREPERYTLLPAHLPAFRQVRVSGNWLSNKQFLLANQMRHERYGFDVLTPFQLSGSRQWVLVDRGWVPAGVDYEAPPITLSTQKGRVEGYVFYPSTRHFILGKALLGGQQWPQKVQMSRISLLSKRLGVALVPYIIRLQSPRSVGYALNWTVVSFPASRHLSYMIQWLLFAAGLLLGAALVWVKAWRKR